MRSKQNSSDNDLSLYISLLSTFYDKVTEHHSKRSQLRKNWQTFKYHVSMSEAENRLRQGRSLTPTSQPSASTDQPAEVESRQEILLRLQRTHSQYKIFMFNSENTFYMVLGLSYIYHLVVGKFKEALERMHNQIKYSKWLNNEEFLLKKLEVLFEYLLKSMQQNTRESQILLRLQSFCTEDNSILAKAIKIVLNARNPVLMSTATLSVQQPGNNELKTICGSLDIALTVLSPDESDVIQQNIVSKRGKYHILMGYDPITDNYFQLEPQAMSEQNPSVGQEKAQGLGLLLRQLTNNGDLLRKLKCAQKVDFNKNEQIKQRTKALRSVK